jgi:uncharacterized phage protein gp47/JayE
MAGLTDEGLEVLTLTEVAEETDAELRVALGDSIDLSPNEPVGAIKGVFDEREARLWDLAQSVHNAFDPNHASGASLDALCALVGVYREDATPSEVTAILTGTPGTVVTEGRVASVAGTGVRFQTMADATIAAATAWAGGQVRTAGDIRTNNSRIYVCTTGGTTAGSGGPTTTATAIADNTVVWRYVGEGTGYVEVAAESEDTGPKVAAAFTLTTIETAVGGWSSVNNLLDADLGTEREEDADLNARREEELRAGGNAAIDAIRSKVLQVEDVAQVTVFQNTTMVTDGDGIPAKAVEVLVSDGDDDAIYEAVFSAVAGGIETHGTESGTVVDSQGFSQTVKFSRPTDVDIWVIANLVVNADEYPDDGDAQVEAAIVAFGDAQRTGKNVVASALEAQCHSIPGVLEAECLIKTSNPPTVRTTIAITLRQRATFDTSRITINATPGTP